MRDYLTLSWARFSKDVQAHTLQIAKILSHPAPRGGDVIRLDASPASGKSATKEAASSTSVGNPAADAQLEVVTHFPGGLDFGRGVVVSNFTMWPLFAALNIDINHGPTQSMALSRVALSPYGMQRVRSVVRHS